VFAAAAREVQEETGAEIVGTLTTSEESLEVGYFPLSSALEIVTWPTFRDRITMSLSAETLPFCVVYPTKC
jgi:8-oxo-dGTP diphosphatase